ncbi:MAG: hypothetical protein Q8N63_09135 [Nanoarchaeota archaeon]|nr:hypothetical protein [Nanoarchaeota archaeon]
MENKQVCGYFLKYRDDDKHIFPLIGSLYCDKLDCRNNSPARFNYEADGNLVGECRIGEFLLGQETSNLIDLISRIVGGVIIHKQNRKTLKPALNDESSL